MAPHSSNRKPPSPPGVSIAFALDAAPDRVAAFRAGMAALLHAGLSFGCERPGRIIASHDPQGEHYANPTVVPEGSYTTVAQALSQLALIERHYNRSIEFALKCSATCVPVTCHVYDERHALMIRLDLRPATWQHVVTLCRSARAATTALIDLSRTLFTLLATPYLLIGPTALLQHAPHKPQPRLVQQSPVVMLSQEHVAASVASNAMQIDQLPRGQVIVRAWDASARLPGSVRPKRAQPQRHSA